MPHRTAIHAGYVIGFDGRGHRVLRDGTVIVDGDRIVSVGPRRAATTDDVAEIIDAPDSS
jgi:cytosine/adenosine deaminase-related metal-dependent hydrolase